VRRDAAAQITIVLSMKLSFRRALHRRLSEYSCAGRIRHVPGD
jgi:hypothetical protein